MMKQLVFLFIFLTTALNGGIQELEEITGFPSIGWIQHGERWTFKDWMEDKREEIIPHLEKMECFNERRATENHYRYGIVLGSLHVSVTRRINFLIEEWNRGVRFDTIVFLTGQRKLHPEKEPFKKIESETEMMVWTWENSHMPDELRTLPFVVIDAKAPPFRERPNTLATVQSWLAENPEPGSCLAISCQPYLNYQHQILRMVLPNSFSIEIAGPAGGLNLSLSILLDTVARTEILKKGYLLL